MSLTLGISQAIKAEDLGKTLQELLSDEAFYSIFPHFNPKSIESPEKTWRSIATMPFIWQNLIRKCFPALESEIEFQTAPRHLFVTRYQYFDNMINRHSDYQSMKPYMLPALMGDLSRLGDLGIVAEGIFRVSAANGNTTALIALLNQNETRSFAPHEREVLQRFLLPSLREQLPDYDSFKIKISDREVKLSEGVKKILTQFAAALGNPTAFARLTDVEKLNSLLLAVAYGQEETVRMMVGHHAFSTADLRQALIRAVQCAQVTLVQYLLNRFDKEIDEKTKGECLLIAVRDRQFAMFGSLAAKLPHATSIAQLWNIFRNINGTLHAFYLEKPSDAYKIFLLNPGQLLHYAAAYGYNTEVEYILSHAAGEIQYSDIQSAMSAAAGKDHLRALSTHPAVRQIWDREHPNLVKLGQMLSVSLQGIRDMFRLSFDQPVYLYGSEPSPRADDLVPMFTTMRLSDNPSESKEVQTSSLTFPKPTR